MAQVYTVSTAADSASSPPAGSLRAALLAAAQVNNGAIQINFNSGLAPIVLAGHLPILSNLVVSSPTIALAGNDNTVDGAGLYQAFFLTPLFNNHTAPSGTLTVAISDLTITNCFVKGGTGMNGGGGALGAGAALFIDTNVAFTGTNLTLTDCMSEGGDSATNLVSTTSGGGGGLRGGTGGVGAQPGKSVSAAGGGGFASGGGSMTSSATPNAAGGGGGGNFLAGSTSGGGDYDATTPPEVGGGGGGMSTAGKSSDNGGTGGTSGGLAGVGGNGSLTTGGNGTFGGGGGGGGSAAGGNGGGGGGGGGSVSGVGGVGGSWGGGGGSTNNHGGAGGFGGGGGGAKSGGGGAGGFGAGGGASQEATAGLGGLGGRSNSRSGGSGGTGSAARGGGGAGLGGASFALPDVTFDNCTFLSNSVSPGTGAHNGVAFATGLYLKNGSTIFVNVGETIFEDTLDTDGTIIKDGPGILSLKAANPAFEGEIDVQAGTLKLFVDNILGSGNLSVFNDSILSFGADCSISADVIMEIDQGNLEADAGIIGTIDAFVNSNSVGLFVSKIGLGTVVLTADNSPDWFEDLHVDEGTLQNDGIFANTMLTNVSATLSGSGTCGIVHALDGGTVKPSTTLSAVGDVVFASGSSLSIGVVSFLQLGAAFSLLFVSGATVTLEAGCSLTVDITGTLPASVLVLETDTPGSISGSFTTVNVLGLPGGVTFQVVYADESVTVVFSGSPQPILPPAIVRVPPPFPFTRASSAGEETAIIIIGILFILSIIAVFLPAYAPLSTPAEDSQPFVRSIYEGAK